MKTNLNPSVSLFQPDVTLVLLDFARDYQQCPEEALACIQLLLRHRDSCLGRIAYTRRLAGVPVSDSLAPPNEQALQPHQEVLSLIAEDRLFDVYLEGGLTPAQLESLHRLTLDPEALWAAHHWLLARVAVVASPGTNIGANPIPSSGEELSA